LRMHAYLIRISKQLNNKLDNQSQHDEYLSYLIAKIIFQYCGYGYPP